MVGGGTSCTDKWLPDDLLLKSVATIVLVHSSNIHTFFL